MSGGQGAGPLGQRPVQHGAEFNGPVTVETGVGRAAPDVFGDKAVYDLCLKQLPEIQNRVGDAKRTGGGPGGLNLHVLGVGTVWPQAQSDAEDLISLPQQQKSGTGAVNTAAHGHTDALKGDHRESSSFQCSGGCAHQPRSLF